MKLHKAVVSLRETEVNAALDAPDSAALLALPHLAVAAPVRHSVSDPCSLLIRIRQKN